MFYSHTFLARKGPLGTVWCAAHLQHKLRKSQYISTNIPSTVERIMDPQVPIALRMSAHLLLGVVRVYSKQVDYFHEDCNGVVITLNRVYSAVSVNLPDDANHAPVHSITLPQKFSLDALELDDSFLDGFEDTHRKSHEEITLTEQIPTGEDPFIAITFDEHEMRSSSFTEDISGTGAVPMEEDVIPPVQEDTDVPLRDLSEHNDDDANERTVGASSPITSPSFETMRDAGHGSHFNGSLILPDRVEPDTFLDELMSNHDKDARTVINDVVELPDLHFSSPQKHQDQNSPGNTNFSIFSGHRSPQLEIQESPAISEPKVRKRKRKQFFDSTTVLSNEHMKKALADTHDLRRKRRNCPSSSLDVWKLRKRLKRDSIFDEPYLTGSCVELQHIYKEDSFSSKPHLVASTSENAQATSSAQRNTPRRDGGDDGDTEVLRNTEQASPGGYMPSEFNNPSPTGGNNLTPENFSSRVQSERFDTTGGAEMLHSTTVGESTRNFDLEMETPSTFHFEHTSLFDIPEQSTSAGDLDFLEQDDHSVAGFQGSAEFASGSVNQSTPGLNTLSSRTRAVAQYLKRQSPITPIPEGAEETAGDLNLNKVLEGKSRKICARMFFETLVLKSYDLVDLQQEKPYDDIFIKVTPQLSKGDFLG